ncbi:FxLD family lantipeptide [Nonomuraea thailandensis]|uniref:FxLD family lantipeptide n=1 Tax=Nonomuraea thailandensis TaxID=1188745 RepID=A0A9X2GD27_9ACTN|nr:FxLD family lanthipeptide [Nonomuraea thailandensis]MCP2353056.1 FxLD family lantipeptide [Nonomuraea thailandensis]
MAPPATLDAPKVLHPADAVADDEFELDMRVVEATTPLVTMMCATDDGCGTTCSTSACTTSSNDPS